MPIPDHVIDEIRDRADIVEVIGEVVELKKRGRNFVGLCPFHAEKTPSFTVTPEKQMYYCFGCQAGGNVFTFLMQHERLEFPEGTSWSRPQAEQSWALYLPGQDADAYAAPARTEDLTGLPPAYVVTCELDPLRDEGIEYALRLLRAGVSVELHQWPGTFHGSTLVPGAAVVDRMNTELIGVLAKALG